MVVSASHTKGMQLIELDGVVYLHHVGQTHALRDPHWSAVKKLLTTSESNSEAAEMALAAFAQLIDRNDTVLAPHSLALEDHSAHSIIEIALRRRKKVVLIGGGPLMKNVYDRLQASFPEFTLEVTVGSISPQRRKELLDRYAAARAFPSRPLWISAQELNETVLRELEDARMVVIFADNVAYGSLLDLLPRLKATGTPLLPITFGSPGIEIGPLVLGDVLDTLVQSRFGPVWSRDVLDSPAALFSTGALARMSERALDVASSLIIRKIGKPHQNDWLSWQQVRPDEEIVDRALGDTDRLATRRLSGAIWGLENFLDASIGNDDVWSSVSSEIKAGSLVSIDNAFTSSFAEAVHHALDTSNAWQLHEFFDEDFFYHHHNIYDLKLFNATLLLTHLIFNSESTIQWIEQLTGLECSQTISASPSWYMAGDHSTPHSDAADNRLVAFVWHLTKNWSRKWGGHLVWCRTGDRIPPSFNRLNLFDTRKSQSHFVMTVAPLAQSKRLTWNGWWRGEGSELTEECSRTSSIGNRVRVFR